MYLSKVEIFGFKSFANKVEIKFNSGLTAIVGPNGCGKTNVVDAIRWALGEQRTSMLRSDKMENVIFNGTIHRKPLGMAEVSLTIQNNKGILPIEYTEVTITRRLFRSGESEYLINKTPCRLKDIQNLFMDTGMSSNAYSVIELKMIEDILSNRADDRRILFEEAAGVNKYKHRRKAALRKLEAVKQDLIRVNDIYAEVQKKVNSLERQSKKAEQFNKLYQEAKELEINLAERELFRLKKKISEAKELLNQLQLEKQKYSLEIDELDANQQTLYRQLDEIEKKLESKREEILQSTEEIYKIKENIVRNRERFKNNEDNISRLVYSIEEGRKKIQSLSNSIEDGEIKIIDINKKIEETKNLLQELENRKHEYENLLRARNQEIDEKRKDLQALYSEFNELKNQFEKLSIRIQNNNESIKSLNDKISKTETTIEKLTRYIEELTQEHYKAETRVLEAENALAKAQERKTDIEQTISELKQSELETRSVLNALKNKIEFIQNLIDNLEGITKGTKELLLTSDWAQGERILVADAGSTDEKFRIAAENILKNYLSYILLQAKDDLINGINYLKERQLGQANFFFPFERKDNIWQKLNSFSINRKKKKVSQEKGFVCWLKDVIEYSKNWEKFFNKVLGNVCVVDNEQTAQKLIEKYPHFDFVTLDGDVFRSSGFIEVSGEKVQSETAFGRKRILSELNDIYIKETYKLEQLTNKLADLDSELKSINIKAYQDNLNFLRNDATTIEKQLSQIHFEKNKAIEEIEKINLEINNFKKINDELNQKLAELKQQIDAKQLLIDSKKSELNKKLHEAKEIENIHSESLSKSNELKITLTKSESELVNIHNLKKRNQEEIISIQNDINRYEEEISKLKNENNSIKTLLEELELQEKTLDDKKKILTEEQNIILSELNSVRAQISENDKILHSKRKLLDEINEKIHQNEILVSEGNLKTQNLIEKIREEYQHELEFKEFDDSETFNFAQEEERLHSLKMKIRSLGPVNSLAFQEYEEEKKRLEFLTEQRNDLIESEKELMQVIEEINQTAQKQFLETFEKIRLNFIETFRTLFDPGDEADLRLEEGVDPLEAKIEIIAKPKGKRPTSIDLLSQGEKTLTATALLFAIYLVKPSPFCILDEVDAPLDDANIKRFIRLINKFSDNTQFIIVTHNKLTMEAAQTLYGVTMEEEGVSKIVAVRFTEEATVA
ncbi:MAG: chromosome segregation protein SMC [Ignavibacteria bacterium]|nr:chromosome segregation protein SMC [Ignavibacteria bacterium]